MAVKKCCVNGCNSCSTRKEDVGVTYHKFPKDTTLRDVWSEVTCHKLNPEVLEYVCSRHFCKSDFQTYKDSKYILKSDAIPSIFSWTVSAMSAESDSDKMETETAADKDTEKNTTEVMNTNTELEGENVDAIKRFIEEQEHEFTMAKDDNKTQETQEIESKSTEDKKDATVTDKESTNEDNPNVTTESNNLDETMAVASSVMDMILSESEAKITQNKDGKLLSKSPGKLRNLSGGDKGNPMALSVGSKVEAKDFTEIWHSAEITEVDYDEMEVLVHYDDVVKKHDEWISVSSPRLRPMGSKPRLVITQMAESPSTSMDSKQTESTSQPVKEEIKVEKVEERQKKLVFSVGERCLARWRDNRRFIATVSQDLGDSQYEIMFDDGVKWTCNVARLSKLKEPKTLTIDTTVMPNAGSIPSPVYGPGPSNETSQPLTPIAPIPSLNNHLFDPTRDYLGSKSERRAMKRKLNIKEIFNIGQKKKKVEDKIVPPKAKPKVVCKKPKVVAKKPKVESEVKKEGNQSLVKKDVPQSSVKKDAPQSSVKKESVPSIQSQAKKEIPDAVASIIGTVTKETTESSDVQEESVNVDIVDPENSKMDLDDTLDLANSETLSAPESQEIKMEDDPEEVKLEKFDQTDVKHEEVLDRMKEVITKLEDNINQVELKAEQAEIKLEEVKKQEQQSASENDPAKEPNKRVKSKIKKVKKVRMLQEKKVKKQVEKVKSELENMKKQMEEMRRQMSEELAKKQSQEMPASFLLPGEWCCRWVNGQPVGTVSETEYFGKLDASHKPALPRRSVQVEDARLPPGWTKHMVRRSLGHSAGKWDVVLMSPDNRRFHTKTDMRLFMEQNPDETLKPYENALMDFGIHLKLSRRMGWYTTTPDGVQVAPLPVGTLSTTSPLVKKKKLSLNKEKRRKDRKKMRLKFKSQYAHLAGEAIPGPSQLSEEYVQPPLEDGCVYVGSLKVEVISDLLRCPADGCFKNFRNNTLLKMHIKHYHRELRKCLGATPKVIDLAHARTKPTEMEMRRLKLEAESRTIKVKLPRLPKKVTEPKPNVLEDVEPTIEAIARVKTEFEKIPRSLDSPKLRKALSHKPKRPKVLLPVRRPEEEIKEEDIKVEPKVEVPDMAVLDFETAISTHTVTKPPPDIKKKKQFASVAKKLVSDDDEWLTMNSDVETRSSYPRSGTPDSKIDQKLVSSESNEEQKEPNYLYTETGERIKIVHMKREEIINCHCGFREEDGLMVQCELCLCWQHALCHNIQKESEVPEKYTCSICLNPRRGRRSQRFLHDQDRLYEGLLPGARPCELLRRAHELSGNLHRIEDATHALRVKCYVAHKKDHPKLYLWAKDWETQELTMTQERLNSDYSDLGIMISSIGKENLPVKDDRELALDIRTPLSDDPDSDRFSQRDSQLGSQALLSGLLSSPGGASLDLPISTTELERLAKTVQAEAEALGVVGVGVPAPVTAPVPEAAIENGACRERLLRHIQRCQALLDARLDSIEAQVAELESQDPSFEDDETADYFPRTKQTIQMMMRDLDTMEELGVIT